MNRKTFTLVVAGGTGLLVLLVFWPFHAAQRFTPIKPRVVVSVKPVPVPVPMPVPVPSPVVVVVRPTTATATPRAASPTPRPSRATRPPTTSPRPSPTTSPRPSPTPILRVCLKPIICQGAAMTDTPLTAHLELGKPTVLERVGEALLGLALFVYPRAAAVLRKVRSTR